MGKFIYSGGTVGLWEPARPLVWPLVLGFFWIMGGKALLLGSLLTTALSAASIYILYLLIKELVGKKAALLFSLLFALNTVLIFYSNKVLTDIPAMFFTLLSVWFLVNKNKAFSSGTLIGIAALTKFTSVIFIPILLIGIYLRKKNKIRDAVLLSSGSIWVLLPYLLINQLVYHNFLYPLIKGQELINTVVGNYYCPTGKLFLLGNIFLEVPLLLIAFFSIVSISKKRDWRWAIIAMAVLAPLFYHTFLVNCKDLRYTFLFLPFLYLLAANGYRILMNNKRKVVRYGLLILVMLQIIYSLGQGYYAYSERAAEYGPEENEFSRYLDNVKVDGEVWSSTPVIALTADVKINELVYYPVFDNKKIKELTGKLNDNVQYVLINSCDIPCVNQDVDCPERKSQFLEELSSRFDIVFQQSKRECELTIYKRSDESSLQ